MADWAFKLADSVGDAFFHYHFFLLFTHVCVSGLLLLVDLIAKFPFEIGHGSANLLPVVRAEATTVPRTTNTLTHGFGFASKNFKRTSA